MKLVFLGLALGLLMAGLLLAADLIVSGMEDACPFCPSNVVSVFSVSVAVATGNFR